MKEHVPALQPSSLDDACGVQTTGAWSTENEEQAISRPSPGSERPSEQTPSDDLDALRRAYRQLEHQCVEDRHRLEQAEARCRSFFRLSPDAIVIARQSDGHIVEVNPSFVEFSGYSREEAIGKTTLELGMWEDTAARQRLGEILAAEGSVENFEARFVLKNNQRAHVLVSAATLVPRSTNRLMLVVRDIDPVHATETILRGHREALQLQNDWLQRIQKELGASRQQYLDLFESAPVGYCTLNRDGIILAVNRTGADLLAQTSDALCGTRFDRLLTDDHQQVVSDHLEHVFRLKETVTSEVKLKIGSGSVRFFRLISQVVPSGEGALKHCRTAFLDDTERRRAQASLAITNRFLAIANRGKDVNHTLRAFLDEMKRSTNCQSLGIRMLSEDGGLPLVLATGFPDRFHRLEQLQCGRPGACLCDKVISQETNPSQPFFTANGAFFSPHLSQTIPQILQLPDFQTNGTCPEMGFETMAIIPIRAGDAVLGLVKVADRRREALDRQQVRLLENAALQLGNSIQRVRMEEALRRSHEELEERVTARTAEVVEANRRLQEQVARRERAEKRLRQSREMLQQVFDGISDPLVLTDGGMQIQMINKAAQGYYGLASTLDLAGLQCHKVLSKDSQACFACPIPGAVANATPTDFERPGFRDASRIEKVVIYPVSAARGVRGGAVIRIQDITEEKAMERQLIQSEKLASLGTLVSSVAHEMNNPNSFISFNMPILRDYLNALLPIVDAHAATQGDLELFNMPYADFRSDLLRMIDNIEHGSQRINAVLANLREFSAAKPAITLKEVALPDIVDKALALVGTKVRKTVQTLEVDMTPGLPQVVTDESALGQILVNLLVNAAQAADKPEAWVRLKARSSGQDHSSVQLEVADNGCGMDAAVQERIFDPFYSTKINEGGTGLGLYVCRKLIRQLGGRIGVESTPGEGSRITVTLPGRRSLIDN